MNSSHTTRRWTAIGTTAVAVFAAVAAVSPAPADATGPPAGKAAPGIATTKTVTNTNNSGAGSLRAAIFKVNNPALLWDRINFNIPGAGKHVIAPVTDLPALTAPVAIDGYSQPGTSVATAANQAVLAIVLDATNLTRGLELNTDDSRVAGLVVRDAGGDGIEVTGDNNTLAGNYLGVIATGASGAGNAGDGVSVNGSQNLIGGAIADRNVISDNGGSGVNITAGTGNEVLGSFIGTDDSGAVDLGNQADGVSSLGGQTVVSGNVISGNADSGVDVRRSTPVVIDNVIGLDADRVAALPNDDDGVYVKGSKAVVGSLDAGNTIGSNGRNGIRLIGDDHVVSANFVGINPAGDLGLGNRADGILVEGTGVMIGGTDPAMGNVSSDNGRHGIEILGEGGGGGGEGPPGNGTGDVIENNLVGLDPTGVLARPNARNGIESEASDVLILTNSVAFNVVNGVEIDADANLVTDNTIWLNEAAGVEIFDGTDNPIVTNSIFDNGTLGIDLFPLGVTANDMFDPDGGANNLVNFPVVTSAAAGATTTQVTWEIRKGLPNTLMDLEFFASDACDGSGFGESTSPLGTDATVTNAGGNAAGSTTLPVATTAGQVVTATATVIGPGTSELSACVTVV